MDAITIPPIVKVLLSTLLFYGLVLCVITLLLQLTLRSRAVTGRNASRIASIRTREDKTSIEETLVDFFASSNVSARTLGVLASRRKPVAFSALKEEVRSGDARRRVDAGVPQSAVRAVAFILVASRLARMRSDGLSITPAGREVNRRVRLQAAQASFASMHGANASSSLQTARRHTSAVLPRGLAQVLAQHRD